MPEVQPHPEHPDGGRKYGAFQMVCLPNLPLLPQANHDTKLTINGITGNLPRRPPEQQAPHRDHRPQRPRSPSPEIHVRLQLQLRLRWRRREINHGREPARVPTMEGLNAPSRRRRLHY